MRRRAFPSALGTGVGAITLGNMRKTRAAEIPGVTATEIRIGNTMPYSGIGSDFGVIGRGDAAYFNNPMDYVAHLGGDHLEWLRSQLSLLLVCGQGQWEDTTGALASTRCLAALLGSKGLRYELDVWGYDIAHDWPSWRAQFAHHLRRFC